MLKSNASAKTQREHISNLKENVSSNRKKSTGSPSLIKKMASTASPLSTNASSPKPINKLAKKPASSNRHHERGQSDGGNGGSTTKWSNFKKYQVIDADSISLASLSESPPSEFKFSDEEETNNEEEESVRVIRQNSLLLNKQQQQINEAKARKLSTNSFDSRHLSPNNRTTPVANVSEHIGSNANAGNHINEINKNLERQRVLQEQMNKIKNAKKNFHSVLLKDPKCEEKFLFIIKFLLNKPYLTSF